jgi:hypothetical protein
MMIACLFGRHSPSLQSISRRRSGFAALCEGCARPLEKQAGGRWSAAEAMYASGAAGAASRQPSSL